MSGTTVRDTVTTASGFRLSSQQVAYFRTFGFLKLPGLFRPEIERIIEGFEEVFATQEPDKVITEDPLQDTDNAAFQNRRRLIMFRIIERSDKLRWLASDPRVLNIVTSIIGDRYDARPTDG